MKLFEQYLERKGILWTHLESGRLDLSDQTFREMSKIVPEIAPLRELRHALSEMRLNDLAVGSDGRNRCLLSAFGARSGRNTPSNKEFIFGPAVWLRNLIKPLAGHGLAYIDWIQQEFGIAAALSGDPAMLEAYQSGDCYLAFAKQARAIPTDATKGSHPVERERFKQCILGTNYGMEEASLALRINQPVIVARCLLERHGRLIRGSENGSRTRSTMRSFTDGRRPFSAGPIGSQALLTPDRYAISICRRTAPKCCVWLVV